VSPTEATVQELFRLLPDLEELEALRASLASAAAPDPSRQWDRAGRYGTVDGRVASRAAVEGAVDEAERLMRERLESLFGTVRALLGGFWSADDASVARALIAEGERCEADGRLASARLWFERALELSLPHADRAPQILALRRLGRVARALGQLGDAAAHYRRSLELALDAGDVAGAVIAETGAGNVLAIQGRFAGAESAYRSALRRAEESADPGALELEISQLQNNLAMSLTRQDRLEEAESWFATARAAWARIDSPADLAVCLHNFGLLRLRAGRPEEALREMEAAMALPVGAATLAAIAIDLAECCAGLGRFAEADRWARTAEDHAIASLGTYPLGHLYLGLGKLARARGETHAFIFYEKALEIARRCDFQLLEAETLKDYALLRESEGGAEEARSYLERANEILG
jgi:tetratricopeptide (TPR) repeat protein